jgi:peptide/nickel transport system substrate-binding protein/oligopeptide transport system substrate-binding protein
MHWRISRKVILLLIFLNITINGIRPAALFSGSGDEKSEDAKEIFPVRGGNYRRGLGHDPATLDPAKITDVYEEVVTQQIFEGLVQYSDNLMVIPCVAESWESSRDNLYWVFSLKKNVRFHNGREVTAQDFIYSFTRILHPETKSLAASLLTKVEGAQEYKEGRVEKISGLRAPNRYTLEIQLSESFPPFIAVLAMVNFGVVPHEEVEKLDENFGQYPVGTGPFCFESWNRNKEIVLAANEDYHEGRPNLDRVIFKIFPGVSIETMFHEFELGNLEDSLLSMQMRQRVLEERTFQVLQRPSLVIRLLVMNNTIPPFTDKRVRQALNYAIDKERISIEIGKGKLIPATGLIPEGMAGFKPEIQNYPFSPEKARELLEDAGFPQGNGLPVIQFWSSVKSAGPLAEDEAIKKYLTDVGINVEFNYQTDWPSFKKMIQEGTAPIFKYSWEADIPDPDNILSSLFYSQSMTNRAYYRNEKVDELIRKAQNESDYRKRISLYSTIQDRIMEDAPVILLNYLAYERVFQPYVRNIEGKVLGDHNFPLKKVWLDRETTE